MTTVPGAGRTAQPELALVSQELARRVVGDAVRRYFAARRARVPGFLDRTYSLKGAFETHRHAFGHDLWRAPLNAALVGPALALKGVAWASDKAGQRRLGGWLRAREIFLRTDVAREIEWRLLTDLLELPHHDGTRLARKDALAEEILADKRLASVLSHLDGPWGETERRRLDAKLTETLAIYTNSRFAMGELANMGLTAAAGAALVHQFTPGIWTLGPALAELVAAKLAIASLPLGATAGAALVAAAPATPGVALTLGSTAAVLAANAAFSAVSGIITDPLQKALGLHTRRLHLMLDALERAFLGDDAVTLAARDAYVMRVAEVIDLALSAWRYARF